MTPKQILDSFSETLIQDERILSAQERALLNTLLQHAKAAAGRDPATKDAALSVLSSAIGETVAHRAFAVLGESVVDRILESNPTGDSANLQGATIYADGPGHNPKPPQPPGTPPPQPPGTPQPIKPPQPPGPLREAPIAPPPAKAPQPPGSGSSAKVISGSSAAVAEPRLALPAKCVVLDEFLAPQELEELTRFAFEHEAEFTASEVVSHEAESGVINDEHRRSRVLMKLGRHQDVLLQRMKDVLPQVLERLGMEEFSITDVEAQITASNDGDFFRFHSDNGSDRVASRYLTFVYFFHREPRQFSGGELRIHDARREKGTYVSEGTYQTIVPRQNQIVLFPCELMHEITPVRCASGQFADSRFTLNGWLRR